MTIRPAPWLCLLLATALLLPGAGAVTVGRSTLHVATPGVCNAGDANHHSVVVPGGGTYSGSSVDVSLDFHEAGVTAKDSWIFRFQVGSEPELEKNIPDNWGSTDAACGQKMGQKMKSTALAHSFTVRASAHHGTTSWAFGGVFAYHDYYDEGNVVILAVPVAGGGFLPGNPGGA